MRHGQSVSDFEKAFSEFVGAKYSIAMCNGTTTIQVALMALGVQPGDRVATSPLTMAATSIAILNAGAVPVYCDVDPDTWLMKGGEMSRWVLPVALYGLTDPSWSAAHDLGCGSVTDAAQTLTKDADTDFVSYSFQSSKILSTGEGGMLTTNNEELATRAREIGSLGYRMAANQSRIDSAVLKSPTYERHHYKDSLNSRMNDITAAAGIRELGLAPQRLAVRRDAAALYRDAIAGCDWLTPQHVPDGCQHDMWAYTVSCDTSARALWLADAIVKHGGERPYPAWRITYQEPAFGYLARRVGTCPIAESLQPRLLQMQTNNIASAETNARALRRAIQEGHAI